MELKLLEKSAIGKMIDKLLTSANKFSKDLHETAVQCVLHAREHGDLGFVQRLDKGLSDVTGVNVQGLRKWFGDALPIKKERDGTYAFWSKDSDGYAAYIKRMTETTWTDSDGTEHKGVEPDETNAPGSRICFVDFCSEHPFWTDKIVQAAQRQAIRVIGVTQLTGQVYAIQQSFKRALESGAFGGNKQVAEEFLSTIIKQTEDFKRKHSAELINEEQELKEFRERVRKGETTKLHEDAKQDADAVGKPETEPTDGDIEQPEVGGDVTENLGDEAQDEVNKPTGTEG